MMGATPQTLSLTASTPEVRHYLAQILTQKYHIPSAEAESLVQAWRYGTGKEVFDFDAAAYRDILGPEIGMLLYKHHFPTVLSRVRYYLQPPARLEQTEGEKRKAVMSWKHRKSSGGQES
jgi:hypothetical protein